MKIFIDEAVIDQALEALDGLSEPYDVLKAITALRQAKEQPTPPPECKTEAEKTAFGFGWWKAMESQREQAQQPEPMAWRNAALRVGEDLCSVGPFGYYDMTAEEWLDWALSVVTVHAPPPLQQAQQAEPVAWFCASRNLVEINCPAEDDYRFHIGHWEPLYLAPPTRQPLTDEEIWRFWWARPEVPDGEDDSMEAEFVAAVRRVLAAHGIKGDS